MQDLAQKIATKMNCIKYDYIGVNNRLYEKIYKYMRRPVVNESLISPKISNQTIMLLNSRLRSMRENAVDVLGIYLKSFLESEEKNYSQGSSSPQKPRRFPKNIVEALEDSFNEDQYPTDSEKSRLAKVFHLTTKQVNNWFTNKRN
ncbi:homeobox domain-containing protein, partial [Hamiltosporidium magnivora]